jgi:hypothetical protein
MLSTRMSHDNMNKVMNNEYLREIIKDYTKDVFAETFKNTLKGVYFDEMHDDGDYISSYMFTRELLEQLRCGMKASYTHGYLYHYGGEGSAWGNMYDKLVEAYNNTTTKFEMISVSKDEPFEWTPEDGKIWLNTNFEHLCEMYEETQDKSEEPYYESQPDYWGDLSIFIHCRTEEERRDAICWLEEFISVAENLAN